MMLKMASGRLLLITTLLAPPAPALADAGDSPLSLQEALSLAMSENPALGAARLRLAVGQAGIGMARERPNPEFRVEAERETPHEAYSLGLPIEIGGKRARRIEVARAVAHSGEAELARTMAETRASVRRAYYALGTAQRRVALSQEVQALAGRVRDAARQRFEAGDASRLEVLQAELSYFEAENQATGPGGELIAARSELNTLVGRDPATATVATDDVDTALVPPSEAAIAQALGANARLAVLDRQIEEALARAALARAQQVPDALVEGALTHDAPPEFDYGWRAALGFTVPLFTRHRAAVRVEEATVAQIRAERAAVAQRIRGAVLGAVGRATAQRQQYVRYRDDILPRTAEVEAMAEDSYRSGQSGLLALLQSVQAARDIRGRAVQAGYDYQLALADLEEAAALGPGPP